MYGTVPDVVISKQPRNNQFRVVVALGVGVMIGALGTTMLFPVTTKETEHPTPAPRPILASVAAMEDENFIEKCPDKCVHYLWESKKLGSYGTQERMNDIYERCLPY